MDTPAAIFNAAWCRELYRRHPYALTDCLPLDGVLAVRKEATVLSVLLHGEFPAPDAFPPLVPCRCPGDSLDSALL